MDIRPNALMVSAGCLLFFNSHRYDKDVMDSTLFSQLVASKKHSRFTEYDSWRQAWLDTALHLGWSYQSSLNAVQPAPDLKVASFWDWVRASCPAFVSPALVEQAEAALRNCSLEQAAFTLLCGHVLDPQARTLAMQVGLVDTDDSLTMLQLHFDYRKPLSLDSLFGPWSEDEVAGNIRFGFCRLALSSEVFYQRRREELFHKLDDRRPALIFPVHMLESEA